MADDFDETCNSIFANRKDIGHFAPLAVSRIAGIFDL